MATFSTPFQSNSSKIFLYIILPLIIILLAIGLAIFWKIFTKNQVDYSPSQTSVTSPSTHPSDGEILSNSRDPIRRNNGTIILPVSIKNPIVNQVAVGYVFIGKISAIKDTPTGIEVITDIKDKNIPAFIMEPRTRVFFGMSQYHITKQVDPSYLKTGQLVRIHSLYELRRQNWRLMEIYIDEVDTNKEATKAATQ